MLCQLELVYKNSDKLLFKINPEVRMEENKIQEEAHVKSSKIVWILLATILIFVFNTYIGFMAILFAGLQNTKELVKYSQKYDRFKINNKKQYIALFRALIAIIAVTGIIKIIINTFGKEINQFATSYLILFHSNFLLYLIGFFLTLFIMLVLVGIAENLVAPIYISSCSLLEWQLTNYPLGKEHK